MPHLALIAVVCTALGTHPALCKQGRTYYTEQRIEHMRDQISRHEWARQAAGGAEEAVQWIIAKSDQELWDFVPPPEQARALNVSFGKGCPVHGAEVFRRGGHYPWQMSREKPFKVVCPVGGEEYPSNDLEGWNLEGVDGEPERGEGFVDRGLGWVDAEGNRYWFVAHYVFWQRWQRDILPAISSLAQAYLVSDDPVYAHKCAVLLARIAELYERYDYRTQAYHNGAWPAGINGRILDYIWENGTISNFALAYDAIWPALEQDPELTGFLAAHGVADVRGHIETRMLHVMARDIMRGFIKGNTGMHQSALARLAIVLANDAPEAGPTTAQMRDWLLLGDGDVEYLLWNGFYRDGHGGESSPSYSTGWCTGFYEVARLLPGLGVDIWANPKLKKMADIGLDLTVAGEFTPAIGDSGSILGSRRVGWSPVLQGPAFRHFGDPRHAKALTLMGAEDKNLWDDQFDEDKVAAVAAEQGTDLGLCTRNLGGYGLAVLESGEGDHRRGVSMYYGHAGGGHGHRDRLNIEMFALGMPMLPDMGYPAHWLSKNTYWTSNTISHYAVLVDQAGQKTTFPGHLNTLAASPFVQLMDASADEVAYPGITSLYRRTTALVDISAEASYLLDIYRVEGGRQHDWSFHGPPLPQFSVAGGEPGPVQQTGTLAGEDVAFGQVPPERVSGAGAALRLPAGEGVIADERPYADRSNEGWAAYSGGAVLTRKVGARMTLKTPEVGPGKVKLFLQVHDYKAGANAVEATLGDVSHTLRWEPEVDGKRWISQVYDLPRPAHTVTIVATEYGQSYVLLNAAAIGSDPEAEAPLVVNAADSGFQYLFNVRRMRPPGPWSATWNDPERDLALTMSMPAGCAEQVILVDAEPELKPGHPDTLQYILARNGDMGKAATPDGGLASSFVSVSEPHRGTAKITSVERLQSTTPQPWAEGLCVRRGEQVDLIHSSLEPETPCRWEWEGHSLTVTAEFALVTLDKEGISRAFMANGTALSCDGLQLHAAPSPAAEVLSVDHGSNTVTVAGALPTEALVGRVAIVGNELHQTSYTVQSAEMGDGETTLCFGDTLFVVGMGEVTQIDAAAGTVATDTQLTGYGRVDGGRHRGRWLYTEDRSRGYFIEAFEGGKFRLETNDEDLGAAFADANGDGRALFWISDIGPGDHLRLPSVTGIQRRQPGTYDVQMMTEVKLEVDAG